MNVYIGHYIEVLRAFTTYKKVDYIIVEAGKYAEDIISHCEKNNIKIIEVKQSIDIVNWIKAEKQRIELCIVASFGLILKNDFINRCDVLINIHPGNFKDCRGRHPLPFAIIKRLENMTITAHLIDSEEIDAGPVIAEFNTPIDYETSYESNYKRLRLLLEPITSYIFNQLSTNIYSKRVNIENSKYNKRLSNEQLSEILSAQKLKDINYESSN